MAKSAGKTSTKILNSPLGAEGMNYWLVKSEPFKYSWEQFLKDGETFWDGVRNYQARNYLRDTVKVGDGVLFYHSNADPACLAGVAKVVKAGHPDPTAFLPDDHHYDPASDPKKPTWYQVSIQAVAPIDPPIAGPNPGIFGSRFSTIFVAARSE